MLGSETGISGRRLVDVAETSSKTLGPSIRIPSPGDPSAYFAPISPAAKTSDMEQLTDTSPNPLMEMLRGGRSGDVTDEREKDIFSGALPLDLSHLRGNKNVKSVEELEADIKQMVGIPGQANELRSTNDGQIFTTSKYPDTAERYDKDQLFNIIGDGGSGQNEKQEENEEMSAFRKFVSTVD